jgi:predicted deacetylase
MLPRHEAALRLTAARRAARAVRLDTDVFVPPRWLASPGTVEALRAAEFVVCADEAAVRLLGRPGRAEAVVRARVLGFRASGERLPVAKDRRAAEVWRARLLVAEAGRVARRRGLVRIGLRAKDLRKPARVRAALAAVDAVLALGAEPVGHGHVVSRVDVA